MGYPPTVFPSKLASSLSSRMARLVRQCVSTAVKRRGQTELVWEFDSEWLPIQPGVTAPSTCEGPYRIGYCLRV